MWYNGVEVNLNKVPRRRANVPWHGVRKDKFPMQPHDTTRNPSVKLCECGCGLPAPVPQKNDKRAGWIKDVPLRFRRGHHKKGAYLYESLARTFWDHVVTGNTNECWEWRGSQKGPGYGYFTARGKPYYAHRASWEIHNGPIPTGMFVCHRCDNPACVNPAHLFIETHEGNVADKVAKNRQPKGGQHNNAKISELDVIEIRRLHKSGLSQRAIAEAKKISASQVNRIILRKSWGHVE